MILGVGIDLCEIERFSDEKMADRFLSRFFTDEEQAYIASRGAARLESLAGHFAAKEAGLKALGCGIVLKLTDIAITHDEQGAPRFVLKGKAQEKFEALGGKAMHLSITHTGGMAAAVAILEGP